MIRTSSPRPWRIPASFSGAPSAPTALSASMPNCQKIPAMTDGREMPKRSFRTAKPKAPVRR